MKDFYFPADLADSCRFFELVGADLQSVPKDYLWNLVLGAFKKIPADLADSRRYFELVGADFQSVPKDCFLEFVYP